MKSAPTSPAVDRILNLLENATGKTPQWKARCPAHDDRVSSLSVGLQDGKVLLNCHADCDTESILTAIGLDFPDLFTEVTASPGALDERYDYCDADGKVVYTIVRSPGKRFYLEPKGTKARILYRLPEALRAVRRGDSVYIVEGEKDADTLHAIGLTATTNPFGAMKFGFVDQTPLRGADVVILPDNDPVGMEHAEDVRDRLSGIAKSVTIVELPGLGDKEDVTDWLSRGRTRSDLEDVIQNSIDRRREAPATSRWSEEITECARIPVLPEWARPSGSFADTPVPFVSDYVAFASAISPMTPRLFHEAGALVLLSVAVARRVVVETPFGSVFTNLFVLWLARSTLFRKTTALDIVLRLANAAFPHLLLPDEATPEALIASMSGLEPINLGGLPENQQAAIRLSRDFAAQRSLIRDEISGLLVLASKDYGTGLIEFYLKMYEGGSYRRLAKGSGHQEIVNGYLTILGGSTPAAMQRFLSDELLWSNGFLPRWAVLTPEDQFPEWVEARAPDSGKDLILRLRRIYDQLPAPTWPDAPQPIEIGLLQEADEAFKLYAKALTHEILVTTDLDERIHASYGRLPIMALKIAVLLAVADADNVRTQNVSLQHMAQAIEIVERWRASLHRAVATTHQATLDRLEQRVLSQILKGAASGGGPTINEMARNMKGAPSDDIRQAAVSLEKKGIVRPYEALPGKKGGRPTTRYRPA